MVLIIIFAAVFVVYAICAIFLMIYYATKKPFTCNSTLVVLGCQVKGNRPSKSLKRRLDTACKFLIENKDICCVVSGGKGSDELISEADCMYSYLVDKGISPQRIFKESTSTNTEENLVNSARLIKTNALPHNIIITTDFYHQLRANIIARRHHIKTSGALSCVPSAKFAILFTLRELIAIPHEILKPIIR
ncbi:MAG: YdcF family protein [Acutalibacteraceae bacterium]|nr:YdcF family protein [Acutalibacteraceae bacterium]